MLSEIISKHNADSYFKYVKYFIDELDKKAKKLDLYKKDEKFTYTAFIQCSGNGMAYNFEAIRLVIKTFDKLGIELHYPEYNRVLMDGNCNYVYRWKMKPKKKI